MVEPELKDLLQKNLEASEKSLSILKKMRRAQVWGGVATFIKWGVIIAVSFGAYYLIEPYLRQALDTINSLNETANKVQSIGSATTASSTDLLKKLEGVLNGLRF